MINKNKKIIIIKHNKHKLKDNNHISYCWPDFDQILWINNYNINTNISAISYPI